MQYTQLHGQKPVDSVSNLHHALFLSEQGFKVFPCYGFRNGVCSCKSGAKCSDPGKHPGIRGWPKLATSYAKQVREWWTRWPTANVAIATGGHLAVIDIDVRQHNGLQTLNDLEAMWGPLPKSLTATTGSGGLHVYCTIPNNRRIKSRNGWHVGIDIKADGGYVLAPPSINDRGIYAWNQASITQPPAIPRTWIAKLPCVTHSELPNNTLLITTKQIPGHRRHAFDNRIEATGEHANPHHEASSMQSMQDAQTQDQKFSVKGEILLGALSHSENQTPHIIRAPHFETPNTETGVQAWDIVARHILKRSGTTNDMIRRLATALRNLPDFNLNSLEQTKPFFQWWYRNSAKYMSDPQWERAWKRWTYLWNEWGKRGTGPAYRAMSRLEVAGEVEAAMQLKKHKRGPALLRKLCEAMQEDAGRMDWYLARRTAWAVLTMVGIQSHHGNVGRWLNKLVCDGVLVITKRHQKNTREANHYMTSEAFSQLPDTKLMIA